MLLRRPGKRSSIQFESRNLPLLLLPLLLGRQGLVLASCCFFQFQLVFLTNSIVKIIQKWFRCLRQKVRSWEDGFIEMNGSVLLNQICFFQLCDQVLGLRTSLYALLFYNFSAYCFTYIKELTNRQEWTVPVSNSSQIRHLAMSVTKIVLEWTKVVTFVITLVTLVLVFYNNHNLLINTSPQQLVITLSYYIITEKLVNKCNIVIEYINGLEHIYTEYITTWVTIILNILFSLFAMRSNFKLCLWVFYINVWLGYRKLGIIKTLIAREWNVIDHFKIAEKSEIIDLDDNCAICLDKLNSNVRMTNCRHYFHANCLRLVVKSCDACPICKRKFSEYY